MTKKEFGETMQMIAFAYRQNSLLEKDVLNVWYKFLGNYASSVFQNVAECWIRENNKWPAISDLHELCQKRQRIYDEELRRKKEEEELIEEDEEWWKYGPNSWDEQQEGKEGDKELIGDNWMDVETPWGR